MVTENDQHPHTTGTGSIGEANLRRRVDVLESERDRFKAMSEGWRAIGDALLATATGFHMKGFGDIPPIELIEPLSRAESDGTRQIMISTLRDALLGQAWRCRGADGKGSCDYPLCPQGMERKIGQAHKVPIFAPRPSVREGASRSMDRVHVAELLVCSVDADSECYAWARWIASRALAGRIKVL